MITTAIVVKFRMARAIRHCEHCHGSIQPATQGYYGLRGRSYHVGCLVELSRAK